MKAAEQLSHLSQVFKFMLLIFLCIMYIYTPRVKTTSELKEKNINDKTPNQIRVERLNQNLAGASLNSDVLFISHLYVH